MKPIANVYIALMIGIVLSLGSISDVDAKRMGGGRSFGSRSTYSQPYQRSAHAPASSPRQQQATAQNQAARDALRQRGGWRSMLGGLALGGLLGALFFGGAFEGINFLDIALLGGLAYLLLRLFAAKSGMRQQPAPSYGSYERHQHTGYEQVDGPQQTPASYEKGARFDTDLLFNKDKKSTLQADLNDADFMPVQTPAGFDQQEFLAGAKAAFKMLQAAWDRRDLAEIRSFTTDKVFAEIQEQLQGSNDINRTEVLKIEAELLDYREIGNDVETTVLFDTIMRENSDMEVSHVREVWHFVRPKRHQRPTWYLDGIQQLEI